MSKKNIRNQKKEQRRLREERSGKHVLVAIAIIMVVLVAFMMIFYR